MEFEPTKYEAQIMGSRCEVKRYGPSSTAWAWVVSRGDSAVHGIASSAEDCMTKATKVAHFLNQVT